ncbi:hypothetical protein [Haloactinomyces albus]|uniref:Ribosomal protein L37AE/L43A n=1 Tax=Haloactinomyces albus TaxID=1352928 RepID=A0AAE3ZGS5_9ACTN|nr:hypothetical protein [Haloactinomyces albus]MDR7302917.1 ribosomal protein L37AE/L43A [Haloactinomyces albus]
MLRTKLAAGRTKVTNKVTERAKSVMPVQGDTHPCIVCGRKMRFYRTGGGEGRVCSPRCAKSWAG